MVNLVEDICNLTTISKTNANEIVELSEAIISHSLLESIKNNENVTEIDMGIGTLYLSYDKQELKYKFIPSNKLEDNLIYTCKNKRSRFVLKINETLGRRIMHTYKDLF